MKTVYFLVLVALVVIGIAGTAVYQNRSTERVGSPVPIETSQGAQSTGSDVPTQRTVLPTVERENSCGITAATTEGPYYVSGVPELKDSNLNYTNLLGNPLTVSG